MNQRRYDAGEGFPESFLGVKFGRFPLLSPLTLFAPRFVFGDKKANITPISLHKIQRQFWIKIIQRLTEHFYVRPDRCDNVILFVPNIKFQGSNKVVYIIDHFLISRLFSAEFRQTGDYSTGKLKQFVPIFSDTH